MTLWPPGAGPPLKTIPTLRGLLNSADSRGGDASPEAAALNMGTNSTYFWPNVKGKKPRSCSFTSGVWRRDGWSVAPSTSTRRSWALSNTEGKVHRQARRRRCSGDD